MAIAARPDLRSGSWSLRLFEAVPLPPVGVGLLLAGALLAAYVGFELAAQTPEAANPTRVRGMVIMLATLAYVPTAQAYLTRWTRRNLRALAPVAVPAPAATAPIGAAVGRATGAIGAVLFALIFLVLPTGPAVFSRVSYWTPGNA
ncbi:MAG: hypothetical protein R3190_18855, partial [Thermoanaerobaculia bacterium]|nr:hypothetical protein [Thermoanaerobaculia bacterium]